MSPKEFHVVSNLDRTGWDSKRENAEKVSKHFDTKKEAMFYMEKSKQLV